jgi:chromosome segregation ATPase
MSPEELLEDLQRRYQLLEGERKATYETAQLNIRQNKEIIKQMREENKSLRQQVSHLRNEAPMSTEKQVNDKMQELNQLKSKFDALKAESKRVDEIMQKMQRDIQEMQINANQQSTDSTPEMRQIRVLENRLDKAMIKYNEAQSIRKTYEQIVKRLKEERVGYDN